jgi:hypothetical protein
MRGRGRTIATVLADALAQRRDARLAAIAAAFSEACGWPLAREVALRAVSRDGCLVAVARSRGWAEQVEALGQVICGRVNRRLGRTVATRIEVRVGPLDR